MDIVYGSKFAKEYKKLPLKIKIMAEETEVVFRKDPFDQRLKTHKLKGKLDGFWSFSIDYRFRIIFEFSKDRQTVFFHSVGDYSVYD